jgi:putative intracellular protease/amidase
MSGELAGKRIAFLVANAGVEEAELTRPWQAVHDAGGEPILLAPQKDTIQAVSHDTEAAGTFDPDHAVGDVPAEDFAALIRPGCVAHPDQLRLVPEAVAFAGRRGRRRADRGAPPCAMDLGRDRPGGRQDADKLAEPAGRYPQRGR